MIRTSRGQPEPVRTDSEPPSARLCSIPLTDRRNQELLDEMDSCGAIFAAGSAVHEVIVHQYPGLVKCSVAG